MLFYIYTKEGCPFCDKAKELITSMGDKYEELKLGKDFDRDSFLQLAAPRTTFPLILDDRATVHIGGFTELEAYYD